MTKFLSIKHVCLVMGFLISCVTQFAQAQCGPEPTVTVTSGERCGTGIVTVHASATDGWSVDWYTASAGGSYLGSGDMYNTASINTSKTFWVSASLNGCTTATRVPVEATVKIVPIIGASSPASRCAAGTVTLGATPSGGAVNWYAASTGGPSLYTGTSFTTPSISSTTTYYAEAVMNGCVSTTRTAVVATVNAYPSNQINTGPYTFCCNTNNQGISWTGNCRLSYLPSGVSWSGGTGGPGGVTAFLSFTPVTSPTDYTLQGQTIVNGCTTTVDIPITVKPVATMTLTPASRCGSGTVTLGATVNTGTVNWYATQGYNPPVIGTGTSFTTPSISATTTYYAKAFLNGCGTIFYSAAATVVPPPSTASAIGQTVCGSNPATLIGNNPTSGVGVWSVVSSPGTIDSLYDDTTLVRGLAYGNNIFRWTITTGLPCSPSSADVVAYKGSFCREATAGLNEEGLNETTAIETTEISPNPSGSSFNLTVHSAHNKEVEMIMTDMKGQKVLNKKLNTNVSYPFGEEIIPGMYTVKIMDGDTIKTYKVVKTE